ncbi:MAG: choline/ethanolamine kinase family protein [Pseudomonadota bacterium]
MTRSEDALTTALSLSCFTAPKNARILEGGITNHNVRLTDQGCDYVVRLGHDIPEHMVLRWNELALSRVAHDIGLSPGVIHSEPGVLVLDYVDAAPLTAEDLHAPDTLKDVVDLLKTLHCSGTAALTGPVLSFWVFHILRSYAAFLRDNRSSHAASLPELLEDAAHLEARVGPVSIVLAHNDLLPANILREKNRFWLIDWEYGGLGSPLFDLGGLATNAALPIDAEEAMLTQYFGHAPDDAVWHSYNAMKCASLLRETMWSMVSEITSTLDFDYSDYTRENLAAYREALAKL